MLSLRVKKYSGGVYFIAKEALAAEESPARKKAANIQL
jgi:hypothetical protein